MLDGDFHRELAPNESRRREFIRLGSPVGADDGGKLCRTRSTPTFLLHDLGETY